MNWGANIDEVRAAFKNWLIEQGLELDVHHLYPRHRTCIMNDAEILKSVEAASDDPSQEHEPEDVWVKVIEYLCPGEEEWQGCLKVALEGW